MGSRRPTATAFALAAAALLVALLAPPAEAGCGGPVRAAPRHHRVPGRPPLALGDSVMIFAVPRLAARGIEADARGCRQLSEATSILRARKRAHTLPRLVILALGANGSLSYDGLRGVLGLIGPNRRLALVTPREEGGGAGADAATVRAFGRAHRRTVEILDWVREAPGHYGWFQPDGLHLTYPGAEAYARLMARSLPLAIPPPCA
ncbi:MAG TPA: hypothetical protein VGI54_10965 [Solirubrobacteraceae bacterium]